jgi:hypothetical protein
MCFTKSSETTKSNLSPLVFYHFQYLRVEVDDQGNLNAIVNLNKSIDVRFINQGFYWYQGMSITNIKKGSLFYFVSI